MPQLTLSMIVKNEEKYLRECLDSVKNVVDEIVLVDTGSTDRTIDIAKEFGAKVFHFDWIDDFSAARNFALSKSTCDYILYLDADERLDPCSVLELKSLVRTKRRVGYYCAIKSSDYEGSRESSILYARLFANSPEIKFTGKIHEQIEPSLLENNYPLIKSKILINHVGYSVSKEEIESKAKRNLFLLLEEYRTTKSPYYAFQLANTYKTLKEKEEARKYFLIAAESSKLERTFKAECYASLAMLELEDHKLIEAEKFVLKSIKINDLQPFAHLLASKIYFRKGDLIKSEEKCRSAYASNKEIQLSRNNAPLSVVLDLEEIIYFGLVLVLKNKNGVNLHFYQNEMQQLFKKQNPGNAAQKYSSVQKLFNGAALNTMEQELLESAVNKNNLNYFLPLLSDYSNKEIKLNLIEKLNARLNGEPEVIKALAKIYDEIGRIDEAIFLLEEDKELINTDPAASFYLLSFYLKKGDLKKLSATIEQIQKNFSGIPEVFERIKLLKEKLGLISAQA